MRPGPENPAFPKQIEALFCGVCHSDIHQAKNEWGNTVYPCMPGHEIVGRAVRVGPSVSRIKVGDIVGVGCMIDSCRTCDACKSDAENYCEDPNSWLATYNGPMLPKTKSPIGAVPLCHRHGDAARGCLIRGLSARTGSESRGEVTEPSHRGWPLPLGLKPGGDSRHAASIPSDAALHR